MCGIFGIHSPKQKLDPRSIPKALEALHHRGPDGRAFWLSPEHDAALGHTRLSIIDLEGGAQPISNEDGQIHIVVNGEFYDFEKQRQTLRARGHVFRTGSDSEIALHLYEDFGVDCLQFLRGEFSFVIWDNRRKMLFAARDRFGIKPLCYANTPGGLFIASEAKALFAAGVPSAWDEESFFHASNLQYTLPDRTLFAGINQLRPGHFLLSSAERMQTYCYWDLDYGASQTNEDHYLDCNGCSLQHPSEEDLIDQFRQQLIEAVELRLRADTPVCCHLSGGLDSSAVVAIAAQRSSNPLQCFSVSFQESSYDELEIAQRMATHVGAELQPVVVSQEQILRHLPEAVFFSEGLAVNGHLTAKYLLHKEIRRSGYKVALTGEGSDEIVAGYAHLRSDLFIAEGKTELVASLHATNAASRGIMLRHGSSLPLDAVQQRLSYIPGFLEAKGTLGHKICSVLSDGFKQSFSGRDCYAELLNSFNVEGQMRGRHPVYQSLYLWSKTALANYILKTLGDGSELANSVEGRVPYLDHVLFEFTRSLPLSLKIRKTVEKYVLREAVKGWVTDDIYNRQKHPFVAPPLSLFSSPLGNEIVQDTIRSKSFGNLPFFDQKKLIELLDFLPTMSDADKSATDPVLMTALSASSLQQKFSLGEKRL